MCVLSAQTMLGGALYVVGACVCKYFILRGPYWCVCVSAHPMLAGVLSGKESMDVRMRATSL